MRKRELHEGWVFKRGDIYLANLNPFKGSEQGGTRPVLLLQNNAGNHFSSTLIVAPLTSKLKKDQLPTHYVVSAGKKLQLNDESMVELEQIKTIDKLRILFYIGKVEAGDMRNGTGIRQGIGKQTAQSRERIWYIHPTPQRRSERCWESARPTAMN